MFENKFSKVIETISRQSVYNFLIDSLPSIIVL